MNRLVDLAARVRTLSLDAAPPEVRVALRAQALSSFGAAAAGRSFPGAAALLDLHGCGDDGEVAVLPGLRAPDLPTALQVAATLSSAWSWDDFLPCAQTAPAAQAAWIGGAALGADWDTIERAQLAANELGGRLAGFCLSSPRSLEGQTWLLAFSTALAGGILRDLPDLKLAHALALALARAPGSLREAVGTGARLLGAGPAVRMGWDCAALAERGLEGPLDLLEDGSEFVERFAGGKGLSGWLNGLGITWLSSTLAFKRSPGSAFLLPTLAALEELRADVQDYGDQPLRPEQVLRIDVDVSLPTAAMELRLGRAADPAAEQDAIPCPAAFLHSVPRALALAVALGRTPRTQDLTPSALGRTWPSARDLARRVHVRHDWRLSLGAWVKFDAGLGISRLMEAPGPAALVAAARKIRPPQGAAGGLDGVGAAGPLLGGTGLAWSELPMALAAERLGPLDEELRELPGELMEDPAAALGKGLDRLAGWASRRVDRFLGPAKDSGLSRIGQWLAEPRRASLADAELAGFQVPLPARLRVLLQGGRVWEAEVAVPDVASVATDIDGVAEFVRGKFIDAGAKRELLELADLLLAADASVPAPSVSASDWLDRLGQAGR